MKEVQPGPSEAELMHMQSTFSDLNAVG